MVSVEVLARIESLLRSQLGDPTLVLGEWFDFIAGTSAGAITAALLGAGHRVAEMQRCYRTERAELIDPSEIHERPYCKYDADYFARRLPEVFGPETTVGSPDLRTLLLVVLRNVMTDSPWFVSNNRVAAVRDAARSGGRLDLPLWQVVRASTAAPTYFEPEVMTVDNQTFVFADGGMTGNSNAAFKAFLMATAESHRLVWPTGPERLLVASVGTGRRSLADEHLDPGDMHLLYHARTLPFALIGAAQDQQDSLCRIFGGCLHGEPLNPEIEPLAGPGSPVARKMFSYLRYDVALTKNGLRRIGCDYLDPGQVTTLADLDTLDKLHEIGRAIGRRQVKVDHFVQFVPVGS